MLKNITSRQIILGIALAILIWAIGNIVLNSSGRAYARAEADLAEAALEYKRATTAVSMGVVDELESLVRLGHSEIGLVAAKIKFYKIESETESKKYPDYDSEKYEFAKSELKRLSDKIGLNYEPKYRIPTDLFYVFLREEETYVTSRPREHFAKNGMLATDIGTHQKSLPIYAPDLYNQEVEWTVEEKEYPESTGHTIILTNEQHGIRWLIGHVKDASLEKEDTLGQISWYKVRTGQKIGMSGGFAGEGVTTAPHAHLEFYTLVAGKWLAANYKIGESNMNELWAWEPDPELKDTKDSVKIYLSGYNVGEVGQNDGAPCTGAYGNDICAFIETGEKSIALTSDMRNYLGIELGDRVSVACENELGTFEANVFDEMAARFRTGCIKNNNSGTLCIKGDIAYPKGEPVKGCRATVSKL